MEYTRWGPPFSIAKLVHNGKHDQVISMVYGLYTYIYIYISN